MKTAFFAAIAVVPQILGMSKTVDEAARGQDFLARACADWQLTQDDVRYFFASAYTATSEEIHLAYDWLPCRYTGSIVLDGRQYRFEINAGSFGFLAGTSGADTSYYGCKDRCANLFPFHVYGDE